MMSKKSTESISVVGIKDKDVILSEDSVAL
jgi:hypothetical protein